jgi:hypothetical protein
VTVGDMATPGAVRRVAMAVTRGDQPTVVLASDDTVLSRAIALTIVARSDPAALGRGASDEIRSALLEERWPDAVLARMQATGEILDVYPDEPVWTDRELDGDRVSMELRMAPLFRD